MLYTVAKISLYKNNGDMMETFNSYKVIHADSIEELEVQVNEYLANGFELAGGLTTSVTQPKAFSMKLPFMYAQAVVKRSQ